MAAAPHEPGAPSEPVPHEPVMVDRVTQLIAAHEPGLLVDTTVGAAGHAGALLDASDPECVLVGIDRDPRALELAAARLAPHAARVRLVHDTSDHLGTVVDRAVDATGLPVVAVLYDLGLSSMQLDAPDRGFAFRVDAHLDMRMDPDEDTPRAVDLLDELDADDLARLLRTYGEEPHARRIADAIVAARPVTSTARLAQIVAEAVPAAARRGRTHPATRTFQALRIAVNAELDRFRASLPQALERLRPADAAAGAARRAGPHPTAAGRPAEERPRGGRVAVLAYHSLEDRIAKRTIADAERGCVCPPDLPVCGCGRTPWMRSVVRGAQRPDDAEVAANPRSRSARLRVAERTALGPHRPRPEWTPHPGEPSS